MTRAPHGSSGRGRGRGSSSAASSGATNFIRDHQKLIFGAEFMLHRHHVDNRWVACEPRDEGHEPDSGVHRYDRVHGFAVTDEELEMMRRDPVIAAAERRSRQADKQDSHVQSVGRWAVFERYVLTFHRSEPYADFLRKCRRLALQTDMEELAGDPEQRLRMEAPPALLVLAYMQKLRFDDPNQAFPSRKHGSIRIMASAGISSILAEFNVGGAWPTKDARVVRQLKEWEDDGRRRGERCGLRHGRGHAQAVGCAVDAQGVELRQAAHGVGHVPRGVLHHGSSLVHHQARAADRRRRFQAPARATLGRRRPAQVHHPDAAQVEVAGKKG